MAITSTNYFNRAIVSTVQCGADFDVHKIDSLPEYAIGTAFERGDGAKFRYVHFGAAVQAGDVVSTDKSEGMVTAAAGIINPATSGKPDFENINRGAQGSHFVEGAWTASADQCAGGLLIIGNGTGVGYTYRIKGNTSWDGSTTKVELYDPVAHSEGINAGSECGVIMTSPYANVEPAVSGAGGVGVDNVAVGVAMATAPAARYGWIQTRGLGAVIGSENLTAGNGFMVGGSAGAVANLHSGVSTHVYPESLGTIVMTAGDLTATPAILRFE